MQTHPTFNSCPLPPHSKRSNPSTHKAEQKHNPYRMLSVPSVPIANISGNKQQHIDVDLKITIILSYKVLLQF